jgi:hypothetical protein
VVRIAYRKVLPVVFAIDQVVESAGTCLAHMLSLRQEFPDAWSRLNRPTAPGRPPASTTADLPIDQGLFPYLAGRGDLHRSMRGLDGLGARVDQPRGRARVSPTLVSACSAVS